MRLLLTTVLYYYCKNNLRVVILNEKKDPGKIRTYFRIEIIFTKSRKYLHRHAYIMDPCHLNINANLKRVLRVISVKLCAIKTRSKLYQF